MFFQIRDRQSDGRTHLFKEMQERILTWMIMIKLPGGVFDDRGWSGNNGDRLFRLHRRHSRKSMSADHLLHISLPRTGTLHRHHRHSSCGATFD